MQVRDLLSCRAMGKQSMDEPIPPRCQLALTAVLRKNQLYHSLFTMPTCRRKAAALATRLRVSEITK